MRKLNLLFLGIFFVLSMVGCKPAEDNDDDGSNTSSKTSEIFGNFTDNYSGTHTITAATWVNGISSYLISKINKTDRYLIAKNDAGNPFNGGLYSRFDWTVDSNGNRYYCQIAYNATSAADAEAVNTADKTSPSTGGCGGFAWSKLISFNEVLGEFADNYSGSHSISSTRWVQGESGFSITKISTDSDYMLAKNDTDNAYNGGKYSRLDWATDSSGNLYYCQIAYDKNSESEAEAITTADKSSPSTGGCGGFAWSRLIAFNDVIGEFADNYSGAHSVSATRWIQGNSGFTVSKINADSDYLVAKNDASNDYNGGKYSRLDWTKDGNGDLYYCQIAYDKASESEAEAVTTADSTSPSTGGCGGFAWSKLISFSEVIGEFADNYSGSHSISATRWIQGESGFTITKINSKDNYLITLNDAVNAYNGGKYSRMDWTTESNGDLYYCQIAYDAASASDAEAIDTADDSSPSTGGCGGFAWSKLTSF
ncbi:hypothetical protein KJ966_20570 [bacterium]|nr:hypothetical protein [bacterium]